MPFNHGTFSISGSLNSRYLADLTVDGFPTGVYDMWLQNVFLYDSNMQPLNGYSLEFASDVPEPTSFVLLATVMFGVGFAVKRKFSETVM